MKVRLNLLLWILALCFFHSAFATDLVIDRIKIKSRPIAAPFYVYIAAKAGHSEATFNEPKKTYGSGGVEGPPIEIALNMTIKDVQIDAWATVNLQLDTKEETVTTSAARKKHTARIRMIGYPSSDLFIPSLDASNHFAYELFWHTVPSQPSEAVAVAISKPSSQPQPPTPPSATPPPAKRADGEPISPELFSAYVKLQQERQALDTNNAEAVALFNQHAAEYHAALKKAREAK